jgi:phage shock protein A
MNTQWERRVAELEQALKEARAQVEDFRLALSEAQQQISELSRMHVCSEDAGTLRLAATREGDTRGKA